MDNIFTQLIGIIPTLDNKLQLYPLIPSNWTHFAIENLPYHGTLLTIVWDQSGSYYSFANHTAGLTIYSNATVIHSQRTIAPVNITLPFSTSASSSALAAAPQYNNILANANAPHGLPNISADYLLSTNGDYSPYEAWKMIDGLLWYDNIPQNYWTQNQSTRPWNTLTIHLPRPRKISSISLAFIDDLANGGVITCPTGLRVTTANGTLLAERNPWTTCTGDALNTIAFAAPSSLNATSNSTTPATGYGYEVETDSLLVQISDRLGYAFSITEVQLWVPPILGPRWEAEDGLLGTYVGGFEGVGYGLNSSIVGGGVQLTTGGWVEIGGVRTATSESGSASLTVIGGQVGEVVVRVNWLANYTVAFTGGNQSQTVEVELLRGKNVVTLFWGSGTPWVDAIVVG